MKLVPVWSSQKQGRGEVVAWMNCDDRDFSFLSVIKWIKTKPRRGRTAYAAFSVTPSFRLYAHALVATYRFRKPVGRGVAVTDHADGNGLNNQLKNLRIVSQSQNCQNRSVLNRINTSGFRGVSKDKRESRKSRPWSAQAQVGSKHYHGGCFSTPQAANLAAIALRRKLGFLDSSPTPRKD